MLNTYHIHALHGFLGQPYDWPTTFNQDQFHAYQLFADFPILPFTQWAEAFNEKVRNNHANNIFMGYSLGGRLGLHAVLNNPKMWKAAIFISTHPGLKTEEERKNRTTSDDHWAKRFENDPWEQLMQDWNAQDVFKHDPPIFRKESENNRQDLSKALKKWSLGNQEDMRAKIAALEMPILWIVGEKDLKFISLGHELTFRHTQSQLCIVPETGHRLQSGLLENFITQFIENLGGKDDSNSSAIHSMDHS